MVARQTWRGRNARATAGLTEMTFWLLNLRYVANVDRLEIEQESLILGQRFRDARAKLLPRPVVSSDWTAARRTDSDGCFRHSNSASVASTRSFARYPIPSTAVVRRIVSSATVENE